IALLGDPGQIRRTRQRVEADAEPEDFELAADRRELPLVLPSLFGDLMHGFERRAAELELTTGLERDRGGAAPQRDDGAALRLGLGLPPGRPGRERAQDALHAEGPRVGERREGRLVDTK